MSLAALPEKFRSRIAVRESGCWEWTASRDHNGYGLCYVAPRPRGGGRVSKAHRVIFEFLNGPVASGLELDHLCRNKCCVNPEHLEPVTHAENIARGYKANPRPLADASSRLERGRNGRSEAAV